MAQRVCRRIYERSRHGNEAVRPHVVRHLTEQPGEGRKVRAMNGKAYEVQLLKGQPIENSVRGEQVDTFVGTFKFGELVDRYKVPIRKHADNKGYQRNLTTSRVKKLAKDLQKGVVDLPTAILLSVRGRELFPHLDSSGRYILKLPSNGPIPFYVVDGQHRLEALKKVMSDDPEGGWADKKIHAVIFFNADEGVEMDQFHTINFNAKKIPTDLAFDELKARARRDDNYRKYLDGVNEGWKVDAQELTEMVSRRGVWKGKIRFSNEPKGRTLINSSSFASSLKKALGEPHLAVRYKEQEERAEIIAAYWQGIGKALPECFVTSDEYNIQKTVGVYVFNSLLTTAMTFADMLGKSVTEPDTYYEMSVRALRELSGDNQMGGESVGPNFWKVGAEGASGTYSSGRGQQVLGNKIVGELQENLSEQLS